VDADKGGSDSRPHHLPNNPTVRIAKMTTATINAPSVKLIPVVVYWKGDNIAITAGSRTCKIDQTHFDSVSFSDDADAEYVRLNEERNGRAEFATVMTRDQMLLWVEIRDTLAKYRPEESKPTEEITATVIETPTPVEEKPAPAVAPLPSLANHTATVTIPEGGEEYIGGPTVRKKRVRKTDPAIRTLYDAIAQKTRRYGVDELEMQINRLNAVKSWTDGSVKSVNYEIPTVIRAEIIEPSSVLHAAGLIWRGGSHWIGKPDMINSPMFETFKELLNRYGEGTPNADRLGCYAEMTIEGVAFEDVNQLKEAVSKSLSKVLIKAHTDLIIGLDEADKALAESLKGELTSNEQTKERAKRDNAYRASIRAAHEELNVALTAAQNYDHDEKVIDLMKGLRATVASRRNAFNAQQRLADLKGIEV
jgi:hypothetical protein